MCLPFLVLAEHTWLEEHSLEDKSNCKVDQLTTSSFLSFVLYQALVVASAFSFS